jgi:diguanylate cyclase (GGDEF)-like protein
MVSSSNRFDRADDPLFPFRVKAAFILLFLGIVAAIISWLILLRTATINTTDLYVLPIVALIGIAGIVWLALDSRRVGLVLALWLCAVATYELLDLQGSFVVVMKTTNLLGHGTVWFMVVTIAAFIALPPRRALLFSLGYNALAVIINVVAFWEGIRGNQLNGLLQFHAANFAALVVLWALSQLQKQYSRVERLSSIDSLTGLLNRRSFQRRLTTVDGLYSVVMFDIDFFKRVNDAHGHAFGDLVLREVAATLTNHAPPDSSLARWGGEEFMLLLPNVAATDARDVAGRLCAAVRSAQPGGIEVTLSAGVAQYKSGEASAATLERADEALYRVKNTGRNRATVIE